jgi:hypothetical protein
VSEGFAPVSSPFNYVSAGEWHATTRPTGNDVLVGRRKRATKGSTKARRTPRSP